MVNEASGVDGSKHSSDNLVGFGELRDAVHTVDVDDDNVVNNGEDKVNATAFGCGFVYEDSLDDSLFNLQFIYTTRSPVNVKEALSFKFLNVFYSSDM